MTNVVRLVNQFGDVSGNTYRRILVQVAEGEDETATSVAAKLAASAYVTSKDGPGAGALFLLESPYVTVEEAGPDSGLFDTDGMIGLATHDGG